AGAAAATRTRNLGSRLVDRQPPSAELLIVQLRDGVLRIVIRRHLDERETARAAGVAIAHDFDSFEMARLGEQILKILLIRIVRNVADVEFSTHFKDSCT